MHIWCSAPWITKKSDREYDGEAAGSSSSENRVGEDNKVDTCSNIKDILEGEVQRRGTFWRGVKSCCR